MSAHLAADSNRGREASYKGDQTDGLRCIIQQQNQRTVLSLAAGSVISNTIRDTNLFALLEQRGIQREGKGHGLGRAVL